MRARRLALALLLPLLMRAPAGGPCLAADAPAPAPAATLPEAALRTGDHPGFGRLVVDLPNGASAELVSADGRLVLRVSGGALTRAGPPPHNVRSIALVAQGADLVLAPGTRLRRMHLPGRLVIDVLDPPAAAPPVTRPSPAAAGPLTAPLAAPLAAVAETPLPAPATPAVTATSRAPDGAAKATDPSRPSPPATAGPDPSLPPAAPPATAAGGTPDATPGAAPAVPASALPAPQATSAASQDPADASVAAVTLAFGPGVGAAAFRRGDDAVAVFDVRRAIDTAALADVPAFAAARVQLLPAATVLRLKLAPPATLLLQPVPAGWTLTVGTFPPPRPIRPLLEAGRMRLPVDSPGQVVSVPDPDSGAVLLVGGERGGGQAVAITRRLPEFTLLATWQGVAVEPIGDALALRATPEGFLLDAGAPNRALALDAADPTQQDLLADANRLTRRYAFVNRPAAELVRQMQAAVAEAAATPAQRRTPGRLMAVQAMLSLGMGAEAQALVTLAANEDARLVEDPDAIGLSAIAALLAGRLAEAEGIEDARLTGSDEIALWRAVHAALLAEGSPAAAPVFAATLPLLLAYPAGLRERLLPLAAETLVLGGERGAAGQLLARRPNDPTLDLARAFLARADGATPQALALFDRLAGSPDRRLRARAAVAAAELRLAIGALTEAQAADKLDSMLYAWRGDAQELALRLRAAELRARSGGWRAALMLLRETAETDLAQTWPEQRPALHARLRQTFAAALADDAVHPLSPLDLVTLAEENSDLLPAGEAGRTLAARLADRLVALDLPRRAAPILDKLMLAVPAGATRAELGDRLARLKLTQQDAAGALATLAASAGDDLPAALAESRTLTFARATAASGPVTPAIAALASLDSTDAAALRAELLEHAADWPAAEAALRAYADRLVPPEGALDDTHARILLRLAAAAAQVGDEATLATLHDHDVPRMPQGQATQMLKVLTERPVQGVADLPRVAAETALVHDLPGALQSLMPAPAHRAP
jgi:hypothetical protein